MRNQPLLWKKGSDISLLYSWAQDWHGVTVDTEGKKKGRVIGLCVLKAARVGVHSETSSRLPENGSSGSMESVRDWHESTLWRLEVAAALGVHRAECRQSSGLEPLPILHLEFITICYKANILRSPSKLHVLWTPSTNQLQEHLGKSE